MFPIPPPDKLNPPPPAPRPPGRSGSGNGPATFLSLAGYVASVIAAIVVWEKAGALVKSWHPGSLWPAAMLLLMAAFLFPGCIPKQGNLNPKDATADAADVLKWGKISKDQKYKVLHAYWDGATTITDHTEALAIQLEKFPGSPLPPHWNKGPVKNAIYRDALKQIDAYKSDLPWFPGASEMAGDRYYLYFMEVHTVESAGVISAQILAYDTRDKILYYIDYKH